MSADVSECGPILADIAVVAVSTSSGAVNLTTLLANLAGNKRRFRIVCDQALFYRFDTATGTADETSTTTNRVAYLPANKLSPPIRLRTGRATTEDAETPGLATWFIHKAGGSGFARIYFCDQPTG